MAKVTTPSDTLINFQTLGKSVTLRERKEGSVVSGLGKVISRSSGSQSFVDEINEAYDEEWEGLTPSEKQAYEDLGEDSFQTGYSLFKSESFKSSTQSVCGYAKCGQNVCVGS